MVHFNVSLRPALMMRRVNRPKYVWLFFFNFFPLPGPPIDLPALPRPKMQPFHRSIRHLQSEKAISYCPLSSTPLPSHLKNC
jgi:hypothetical protein